MIDYRDFITEYSRPNQHNVRVELRYNGKPVTLEEYDLNPRLFKTFAPVDDVMEKYEEMKSADHKTPKVVVVDENGIRVQDDMM